MLTTTAPRVISSKCIVLDPDSEPDIKKSSKKKKSCEDIHDANIEITDYEASDTKRTTMSNPTGNSLTRKSLNGAGNIQSCLHKYVGNLNHSGKLFQLINQLKSCQICPKSMESIIGANLCKKYITSKDSYNLKVVNDIIYNETSHIVAVFKEYLIYDDVSEFMRRFYKTAESIPRLNKVNDYYAKYSKVFPNYFLFKESKYMFKNIKRKQRWIDEQQKINAEIKSKPSKLSEDYEDRLFTTNCMNEIDKTDSILGKSQRCPQEQESKILSYMKSQESIKGGCPKSNNVDELGLQELVEKFIIKDSISCINLSSAMRDEPAKKPEIDIKKTSQSRPSSRPRNLPNKEAWMDQKEHTNSNFHRTTGGRASSIALGAIPRQLATTTKNNNLILHTELSTEKISTTRSKSQEKSNAHAAVQKKLDSQLNSDNIMLNIKIPSSTTASSSSQKRSRSTNNAKMSTMHSRNHMDKPGQKAYGTNNNVLASKSSSKHMDGCATARSSSHKDPIPRGKTTSQTPRPAISTPKPGSLGSTRPSSGLKNYPQTSRTASHNLNNKASTGMLRSSQEVLRDNSKLRNLKGVALDLEATNQKLQKHAQNTNNNCKELEKSGSTPGHNRRYKSDYLNSLMNNQNAPNGVLSKQKSKADVRTPPDMITRTSVPLYPGSRPDNGISGYNTTSNNRHTLAVRDDNKKQVLSSSGKIQPKTSFGRASTGGSSLGSSRGPSRGQSRVPCV